jgi:predicted MPP superfamily phosphohydrolase
MKKLYGFLITFIFFSICSAFSDDMKIVQVDNLMFSASNPKSLKTLEHLIQDINKQKNVDFVVFSGNNIAKPNVNDLEVFLVNAKKLKSPYYIILGNKDVNKYKNLGKEDYVKLLQKNVKTHKKITSPNYVFEKNKLIFIVVDGSKEVLPSSIGYYKTDVLDWLEEQLIKYNDRKIIILQHFPLIPPAKRESHYTFKADEYLELLSAHDNVLAVISGHFGTNKEQEHGGIMHLSAPGVPSYKIIEILDYDSEKPEFWSITKQ